MSAPSSGKKSDLRSRLRHAFAVNDAPALDEGDHAFLERIAGLIRRRGMAVPAAFFFHFCTPLNYVGSQALVVLEPFLGPFIKPEDYERAVRVLSNRDGLRAFVDKLETPRETHEPGTERHHRD